MSAPSQQPPPSDLGRAIQDITEYSQKLVREEIELAKAEVAASVTKLAKGAAVGVAAGVFVLFGAVYLLHSMSWFVWQQIGTSDNFWLGFLVVALLLFFLAAVAGFLAYKFIKAGQSPTPTMAIEEAQKVKETFSGAKP